jgi:serine/threonine protein kinase/Flp pilus assembly protein TadD
MSDSVQASSSEQEDNEQRLADLVEEITRRVQAGESVDVDEYARTYSEHGEELRQVFPAMRVLADLAVSVSGNKSCVPLTTGAEPVTGCLGDYRIIQEIGRGGMGIVYEAEQISLKRQVALKVLPFAATLDKRHLRRFQNEAQAAASLRHPNIVQVMAVGCERGVHYFAMEYIEGRTLADVIRELKQASDARKKPEVSATTPPEERRSDLADVDTKKVPQAAVSTVSSMRTGEFFRTAAKLGIQAAEALEHAHQMGVVHRDIKPANLLIDQDGHLRITDFGLAMTQTETNLTMTGDVLGTLRYMSPEQAVGKSRVLDHRADIYSLGVTLYELLTLRPAFNNDDRQKLTRQIVDEDPSGPRQLNRSIPRDLETIVLKAMAEELQDRYATAQELADDLKCFLADEPIRARRPSLAARATKWSRRHRPLVWLAVITMFLAIGLLSASMVMIGQAYDREKKQRKATVQQQRMAEAAANRERAARVEAERQRERAEANLDLAMDALDATYLRAAARVRLLSEIDVPVRLISETERQLLRMGLGFYGQIADQNNDSAAASYGIARARARMGAIHSTLGEQLAAQSAYQEAIALCSKLIESMPDEPRLRYERAHAYAGVGQWDDAIADYTAAIRLDPTHKDAHARRAEAYLAKRDYDRVITDCNEAIRRLPTKGSVYQSRAEAYLRKGEYAKAIVDFGEELRLDPRAVYALVTRGLLYSRQGQSEQAIADLTEAIRLIPHHARFYCIRARFYAREHDFEKLAADYNEAIRIESTRHDLVPVQEEDVESAMRHPLATGESPFTVKAARVWTTPPTRKLVWRDFAGPAWPDYILFGGYDAVVDSSIPHPFLAFGLAQIRGELQPGLVMHSAVFKFAVRASNEGLRASNDGSLNAEWQVALPKRTRLRIHWAFTEMGVRYSRNGLKFLVVATDSEGIDHVIVEGILEPGDTKVYETECCFDWVVQKLKFVHDNLRNGHGDDLWILPEVL